MRRTVKVVAPIVALLAAATTAVAMADPVPPTDPYPRVDDPGNDLCAKEAAAADRVAIELRFAQRPYDRAKEALARGAGSPSDLAAAEKPLLELQAKQNAARYDLAACRSKEGGADAKAKKCTALYLEYNRQVDLLAIRAEQEKLAKAELDRVKAADNAGAAGGPAIDAAELAAALAEHDRKEADRAAGAALRKIQADADCKDGSYRRPQQAPPPREAPVPTSAPAEPTSATAEPTPTSAEPTSSQPEPTELTTAPTLITEFSVTAAPGLITAPIEP